MTVRDLLTNIRPLLLTHEWTTLWGKGTLTELRIDIEHNHNFHSVGIINRGDNLRDTDYYILSPFEHAYYHGVFAGESYETCVLDFEVYRWKLEVDASNDKLWNLEIETRQT